MCCQVKIVFPHKFHDVVIPEQQVTQVSFVSACFIRSTTGTDVHGIIPSSVTTMVINSGGVKSYTRLRSVSELCVRQSDKYAGFPISIRSSGSPVI